MTFFSACFSVSALFCSPARSSSDSSGSSTASTPLRPTMLGKERVTPNCFWKLPIGITARSFRNTTSAIRADTMPMPYWLAS